MEALCNANQHQSPHVLIPFATTYIVNNIEIIN
ncbi:hypothetical protein S122051_2479 [Staphylococcus aureus subsp. aureus 122051]|nr:hypothetical protein S122051_2479 [Staphylococcus aureus subsp. aureus 122051]